MTAKELCQSLRRGSFVYPFLAIQLLAVGAVVAEFQMGAAIASSDFAGVLDPRLMFSSGPFWAVVAGICLFILPLSGVMLMGQEIEEGNHELLLLTQLNRWKIVFGKFITLWGLCVLTLTSLLPYVVVRYMVGGIEWWHEAACILTVFVGSAIFSAGAIGASAFPHIGVRITVLMLFLSSAIAGTGLPLIFSKLRGFGSTVLYHLTVICAMLCFTIIGLALARSRLRLSLMAYEMKPSGMLIGLIVFAPFVIGMATAVTVGYGGWLGLLAMAFVAIQLDVTPKAPKWLRPPPLNIPPKLEKPS